MPSESEEQLEVDQWGLPIDHPPDLLETTFRVKRTSTCVLIVGIQTNCIARQRSGESDGFLEEVSANAQPLHLRGHSHVVEVHCPRYGTEVCQVIAQGFLVANRSVAIIPVSFRATSTRDVLMPRNTLFSVTCEDQ